MSVRIMTGDCRELLKQLPDQSVHCVVTSPPYFGLRDYGVDGQMGLEASPEDFVAGMVNVFREVRRVLRDDGTLWLNLGDSYAGSGRGGDVGNNSSTIHSVQPNHARRAKAKIKSQRRDDAAVPRSALRHDGYKTKDLMGIPWRVAFALQADGWYLRQDIIWSKPNPMPESVTDRCTKSHEYIFLLSKSPKYYYDGEAIAEPITESSIARLSQPNLPNQAGSYRVPGKTNGPIKAALSKYLNDGKSIRGHETTVGISSNAFYETLARIVEKGMRNRRSVWIVPTMPFKEAHFATFPPELIRPCIRAGSPRGGVILDPFGGAGTTGLVADQEQRDAILIELNPQYAAMAEKRIHSAAPLFADVMT